MGSKNCPETPRQKMINMMYLVLTAMLALNVAAQVLEAFKVVDLSLNHTLKAVDMKNNQIYSSFEQAYIENPAKVEKWKEKADFTQKNTKEMYSYIASLKEEIINYSGSFIVDKENPLEPSDFYFITEKGDTLVAKKQDDLNGPSELLVTQKRANDLKEKITEYRNQLVSLIEDVDVELKNSILDALETVDPVPNAKEGSGNKTWEMHNFLDKPLVAVLTLLSKIQIDVKNSEANVLDYLYAQIDAGSFKFNKLGARIIANSNVVLQGEPYSAEVFLAAEDTTQQPEIFINNTKVEVVDGKANYKGNTAQPGVFTWSGLIKYKTPSGVIKNYPFEQEYQVTQPSVTMSATKMNVLYLGLDNPFDVLAGGIPKENLEISMTNGAIVKSGNTYSIRPKALDVNAQRTTVTVASVIGGQRRVVGTSSWRVKRVPDPVAEVAGKSGGDVNLGELKVQQGVLAVLKDFDFDYKYKITQFEIETTGASGYAVIEKSNSERFTQKQLDQIGNVRPESIVFISNIKAKGPDGTSRDLDPISFKVH